MIKWMKAHILFLLVVLHIGFAQAYSVKEIQDQGKLLVLNDGSEWDMEYFGGLWRFFGWGLTEQKNVGHWSEGDAIEIQYPDSGDFVDFTLVLGNLSKKEHVLARLKQAPSIEHPTCLWVIDFDRKQALIKLSDGTIWHHIGGDLFGAFYKYKPNSTQWEVGDVVTLVKANQTTLLWNHTINVMPIAEKVQVVLPPYSSEKDPFRTYCSPR